MFEKLELIKKARLNDPRKSLKWKDYVVGNPLDTNLRLRRLQEAFRQHGPRGLLELFFEPNICDEIILSLTEFLIEEETCD
jgi:hypothetical protein